MYCFIYSTKCTQEQMCCHFSTLSQASPRPTSSPVPSPKYAYGCVRSHVSSYAPHPRPLPLQIVIHVTHLWAVRKYGNWMRRDMDCILGDRSPSLLQLPLLPYEVQRCHDAKQLTPSALNQSTNSFNTVRLSWKRSNCLSSLNNDAFFFRFGTFLPLGKI